MDVQQILAESRNEGVSWADRWYLIQKSLKTYIVPIMMTTFIILNILKISGDSVEYDIIKAVIVLLSTTMIFVNNKYSGDKIALIIPGMMLLVVNVADIILWHEVVPKIMTSLLLIGAAIM